MRDKFSLAGKVALRFIGPVDLKLLVFTTEPSRDALAADRSQAMKM